MALKSVFAPHLGRNVKFGRLPRKPGAVHLHFSDFVNHAAMPPIPLSFDYSAKAAVPLADIYGNDQLGDCAIAMVFHAAAVFTGNATGVPYHVALADVIAMYSRVGGYKPGDASTDNGCVLTDVFKDWQAHGLPSGEKILGYVSINASNWNDVMASGFLFENHCFGVGLPDAWVAPFPAGSGFTWGVSGASDPNNGHAFLGLGGVSSGAGAGIKIDTWGLLGTMTPDAVAAYAGPSGGGELYSVITTDMLAKGATKAPNGVAWADLIAAFNAHGGNLPLPVPPPAPAPPAKTLTLLQAQLYALDLLHNSGVWVLTRQHAETLVAASLAKHWQP